jgi:hypothetical protein
MSKTIKLSIEFLEAFNEALNRKNNSPLAQLVLEFLLIVLMFLLMPIWITNILIPVRKKMGFEKMKDDVVLKDLLEEYPLVLCQVDIRKFPYKRTFYRFNRKFLKQLFSYSKKDSFVDLMICPFQKNFLTKDSVSAVIILRNQKGLSFALAGISKDVERFKRVGEQK